MIENKYAEIFEETQKWANSDEMKNLVKFIGSKQNVTQTQSIAAARFVLLYLALRQTNIMEKKVQDLEKRIAQLEAVANK